MVEKKHSPFLGGAGGVLVSWTKSIHFFFSFPYSMLMNVMSDTVMYSTVQYRHET